MAKDFQIRQLDKETGELKDIFLKLSDYYEDKGDLVLLANVVNGEVKGEQIKILPARSNQEEEEPVGDYSYFPEPFRSAFKDNMEEVTTRRMYTKLYQLEDPAFEFDSYYKCWFHINQNLYRNCNIIVNRKPRLHFVDNIKELTQICKCSLALIYRFMKDCQSRYLIGTFTSGGKTVFVVNPRFALNGNEFPNVLVDLFNSLEEGPTKVYDEEE